MGLSSQQATAVREDLCGCWLCGTKSVRTLLAARVRASRARARRPPRARPIMYRGRGGGARRLDRLIAGLARTICSQQQAAMP
jgi:hypothetical protein